MALQYAPFISDIELPFYAVLFSSKIDHDKLDDSVRKVIGQYAPLPVEPARSCKMQILGNALTRDEYVTFSCQQRFRSVLTTPRTENEVRAEREHIRAEGFIKNVNTIEDFKNADKPAMLQLAARHVRSLL